MSTPQAIGPYRVLDRLGAGGMGVVFRVADPHMPRELALKLMNVREVTEVNVERFWREAEVLGRIRHRSVVRVHQIGQAPEGAYLLMEIVPGRTLSDLVAEGPLEPRRAAEILFELADAVETLHAQGLLHRDIKPGNVIVRDDGIPVLLDFGLVRDATLETLTKTGTTLGTLAYMSPEQLGGESSKQLGPPTDVYALGSILFELLTGEHPFEGEVPAVLVGIKLNDDIPPPSSLTAVPRGLDAICARATRCAVDERYPSAAALRDDLERFLTKSRPRALGPSRLPLVAFAAALILAITVGVVAGSTRARKRASSASAGGVGSQSLAKSPEKVVTTGPDVDAVETKAPAADPQPPAVDPKATALREQARSLFQEGDTQGAIEALTGALELQPDSQAYSARGFARQQLGENEEALADFEQALALDPKNITALGCRAHLRQVTEPEAALTDYTRVIQLGTAEAAVFRARGMLRMRLGDDTGASRDRQQAQALESRNRLTLQTVRFLKADRAMRAQATPPPPTTDVGREIRRAHELESRGEHAEALRAFDRALELRPGDPLLHVGRGMLHLRALDAANALPDLDKAIELAPDLVEGWAKRAVAKSLLGDLHGVINDYDRALALDEDKVWLGYRATAKQLLGDLSGAISDYTRAIELGDRTAATYANRGVARQTTGDLQGAASDYRQVLQLDPNYPNAARMRETIRKLSQR